MTATILGPALGGVVYAFFHGPSAVYVASVMISIISIAASLRTHPAAPAHPADTGSKRLGAVLAGLNYIWKQKLILGSISLDMFAVLLGGAVALLPIYAREILHTGPWGLGLLRSAPGVGAASMAIFVAHWPLKRNVGATMLWCVAGFGVFTILFGLSHSFALSLTALFLTGACDMISVIVRGTLVQLATPDEMRGRVNAVDMILHRRIECPARACRVGTDGRLVRRGSCRHSRRNRHSRSDRHLGMAVPRTAQSRPHVERKTVTPASRRLSWRRPRLH